MRTKVFTNRVIKEISVILMIFMTLSVSNLVLPQRVCAAGKPHVVDVKILTMNGGRLDWSPDGSLLVFDRYGDDGLLDVYTMSPRGMNTVCLTCNHRLLSLSSGHKGNPAWHPNGNWIVFQAEMQRHPGKQHGYANKPGAGYFNELWVISADGRKVYPLIKFNLKTLRSAEGILHPHFNNEGNMLTWSHLVKGAKKGDPNLAYCDYRIRVAPFDMLNGIPTLGKAKEYIPGVPAFYETHGFMPDSNSIIFSGNPDPKQPTFGIDIAVMRLTDGKIIRRVTNTPYVWDEHAHLCPGGTRILFASTHGMRIKANAVHADYWIAEEDGTTWQLTYFNDPDWRFRPKNIPAALFTADGDFSPDGRYFAAYLILGESQDQKGAIVIMELSESL